MAEAEKQPILTTEQAAVTRDNKDADINGEKQKEVEDEKEDIKEKTEGSSEQEKVDKKEVKDDPNKSMVV